MRQIYLTILVLKDFFKFLIYYSSIIQSHASSSDVDPGSLALSTIQYTIIKWISSIAQRDGMANIRTALKGKNFH